jgi:hypothetical protein
MSTDHDDFIGAGWKFPIRVNAQGGLQWSSGPDRIQDAIWIILKTSLGERVMRPLFGSRVNDFIFRSNSSSVAGIGAAVKRFSIGTPVDLEKSGAARGG